MEWDLEHRMERNKGLKINQNITNESAGINYFEYFSNLIILYNKLVYFH